MTRDQKIVKQLQQRFPNWESDRPCTFHSEEQCCVYDRSGQLIELHLCRLKAEINARNAVWMQHITPKLGADNLALPARQMEQIATVLEQNESN